jgi:hypothetical protein
MLAKKYHPDKNASPDAIDQFRNMHEAYIYLLKIDTESETDLDDEIQTDDEIPTDDLWKTASEQIWILKYLFKNKSQRTIIMAIVQKIFSYSVDACIEYLKRVDKHILQIIYDVFSRFKTTLELEDSLLEKIAEILKNKIDDSQNVKSEKIIVHPFLSDLFDEKVYRLKNPTNADISDFLVPLWHHELVYDTDTDTEIIVECFPILPENVSIDEKNNLHVVLKYDIADLWNMENIVFEIGGKEFSICRKELYFTDFQYKIIYGKGIPCINTENMYDVSKKSDVWVYINMQ